MKCAEAWESPPCAKGGLGGGCAPSLAPLAQKTVNAYFLEPYLSAWKGN